MSMVLDRPKNNNNTKVHNSVRRSELWVADISGVEGSIQSGKNRPVLVISNDLCNRFGPTVTIIPLTTEDKKPMPTHVKLLAKRTGLLQDSTALCEQVRTIDQWLLMYKVGDVDESKMYEIDKALAIQVGLDYLFNK